MRLEATSGTGIPRLAVTATETGLTVTDATHVIRDRDQTMGAVFGLVSEDEARLLVSQLSRGGAVPISAPDTPWVAVATHRGRGGPGVVAAASTMLRAGLFCWAGLARGRPVLRLASEPGPVVSALGADAALDRSALRRLAARNLGLNETPYVGVIRIAGGQSLAWSSADPGRPRIDSWIGSDTWGEPRLRGRDAIQQYRTAFDAVVADLMGRSGPLTGFVSGGLDSSFVAATLAGMTGPDRPVLGLSHVPHPAAPLESIGNWDPDDSSVAAELLTSYPGRIRLEELVNTDLVQPLDAAAATAERAWWPVRNVSNMAWVRQGWQIARQRGSVGIFSGGSGNASFSFEHQYAARHLLSRGNLAGVRRATRPGRPGARGEFAAARAALVSILLSRRRAVARERQRAAGIARSLGIPAEDSLTVPLMTRAEFLDWMVGHRNANGALLNTGFSAGVLQLDPYESRAVMEVAAAITPDTWRIGSLPRGFARAVGADRVPDAIRLRTRRGGQSWDEWFVVHDQQDRYEAEVDELASTTVLGEYLDVERVRATMRSLPWGNPQAQTPPGLMAVHRALSLGRFVRMAEQRLAELPDSDSQPDPEAG